MRVRETGCMWHAYADTVTTLCSFHVRSVYGRGLPIHSGASQENEQYASATEYDKTLQTAFRSAEWHEAQFKIASKLYSTEATRNKHLIDDEIKMTNKMTVSIRRARLEKKLKEELVQYELELNARGLAISKSRY